jgi:hypothetical protein
MALDRRRARRRARLSQLRRPPTAHLRLPRQRSRPLGRHLHWRRRLGPVRRGPPAHRRHHPPRLPRLPHLPHLPLLPPLRRPRERDRRRSGDGLGNRRRARAEGGRPGRWAIRRFGQRSCLVRRHRRSPTPSARPGKARGASSPYRAGTPRPARWPAPTWASRADRPRPARRRRRTSRGAAATGSCRASTRPSLSG